MKFVLPSKHEFTAFLQEKIKTTFAEDCINEVKTTDHSHGAKLPHSIIQQFFTTEAPKYDSLAAVESALSALYKKNAIETTTQGIKQVVSNYKKKFDLTKQVSNKGKVAESALVDILDEKALSGAEAKKKEEIVKSMKKHYKDFKKRYGDDAKSVIYATATQMAQDKA